MRDRAAIPFPSESFVFNRGAVHTQLQAAAACLQNSLPARVNCTPVATLHRRSIRLRTPILGFPPPTQNLNIQRIFHGRNTRGLGYWYATGPADKQYTPGDPDFNLHTVISDTSQFVAHVTVENAGKQRFPIPCSLIDEIAAPPGQIYSHSEQKFVVMSKTAAV